MASDRSNLNKRVEQAVRRFWATRKSQSHSQGQTSGRKDQGARSAVTGGAQMDGFVALTRELLLEAGLPEATVFQKGQLELPGYFRAEKKWDLLVVVDGQLLASIEFKSQVGPSFGNNYNNRTEESLGNATDIWAAYREGAFRPSPRPWLGYLMLLEEAPQSLRPVGVQEPHFKVFEEFHNASYAMRYEILLTKLLRERLYDGACLLLSNRKDGVRGKFREPATELAFQPFACSLLAHAIAFLKTR
jgi:hypothetical protein